MKFVLAQEVSRHVRDKACKFYSSADAVKLPKVPESPSGLELIEGNFGDLLPPSTFALTPGAGNEGEENEFGLIIGELEGGAGEGDGEQVVEISFACKLCEFR